MNFTRYTSIDNSHRKLTVNYYYANGYANGDWVVTTKIHGSNFSIFLSKDGEKFSRREGWLEEDEKFYGYKRAIDRHFDKIRKVIDLTLEHFSLNEDANVQLYGEIFGGNYPHPDVKQVNEVSQVQDKVYYCTDIEFYPFDIYVDNDGKRFPVDHDVFEGIVVKAGFTVYSKAIFTGSLKECLAYSNEYPDPTYKNYDLPELEDNICEGNVLKPVKAACEPSGSRVILKSKNDRFTERDSKKKKTKVPIEVSEEAQELVNTANEYITENRLRNVVSHLGDVTQKQFGVILKAFSLDVREDMIKDDPNIFELSNPKEVSIVNKVINKSCTNLIGKNFQNIVDKTF